MTITRDEPACDNVGQALDRSPCPLRFADHAHDLCENGLGPDSFCPHHEAAGAVYGSAGDFGSGSFFDRHGSPVIIDSSTVLLPSQDNSIDRNLLARPHADRSPRSTWSRRMSSSCPSSDQTRAVFGARPRSALDGARGLAPRAKLEHLAKEHQRYDHRCRLEVDGESSCVMVPEGRREDVRKEGGGNAVDVGGAGPERNQRKHIQAAVHD